MTERAGSHALRVRGLKLLDLTPLKHAPSVARSTRAWIETQTAKQNRCLRQVARSTRAWIETGGAWTILNSGGVARSTRAWIETENARYECVALESHALRVRGLKRNNP